MSNDSDMSAQMGRDLRLLELLCTDVMEISPVGVLGTTRLDPWDSLCVITAMSVIDDLYGHVVGGTALSECKTVGDVIALANKS